MSHVHVWLPLWLQNIIQEKTAATTNLTKNMSNVRNCIFSKST